MLTAPNARGSRVGDYDGLGSSGTTFRPLFVAVASRRPQAGTPWSY
jgi:hypothetical protein